MSEDRETVEIVRVAQGGDGVGYLSDGRVVFVPRTLPGDRARVRIVKRKRSWARAVVEAIVEPSRARVDAECAYFERCGGCQWWHASYADEFSFKVEAALQTLERISRLSLPNPRTHAAPRASRYRTKVTFHRRRGQDTPWRIGFFEQGSEKIVEVRDCMIADEGLNAARQALEPALRDVGDAEVVLETAGGGGVVVTIVPQERMHRAPPSLRALAQTIAHNELIAGLRLCCSQEDRVWGDVTVAADQVLARAPLEGARLGSGGFRQAFAAMNRVLVNDVATRVEREGAEAVLELFSGSGNFSFAMPSCVKRLVGVEANPAAVEGAEGMARLAGEDRYEFLAADLSEGFTHALPEEGSCFDLVLLDPPRQGADAVCEELARGEGADKVVYVSCDPACLARDLKTLSAGGWAVEDVAFFDMFPRTAHIETVAVLRRGAS